MRIHNQRGSIAVETLLAILLLILLLHLAFPILVTSVPPKYQSAEVLFFFHQLEIESLQSKAIYGNRHTLYFTRHPNRTVQISSYGSFIRRQVNNQGHEILLRDINEFQVSVNEKENIIRITVILRNGDRYEKLLEHII